MDFHNKKDASCTKLLMQRSALDFSVRNRAIPLNNKDVYL
jgi:hypothetical protein